ncbi:MAG TPA: hypothetical protein VKY90_00670 [Candidatus Dormibacteraeota bacterium]|nr:hypothetical protein [Candidatus Dormibacteraeota bacterium]
MSLKAGGDADGLPVFPPLPSGRITEPTGHSLVRLVTGIRTAVLTLRAGGVEAMLSFVDHEPASALAVRGERRVVGLEALDEVVGEPIEHATVTEVVPEVARVLGSYFLPTQLHLPAGLVVPEAFCRGLAPPGQRGCIIVRGRDELGLVFLGGGRLLLAYRQGGSVGGFEQVAPLFAEPEAELWARLGPDPARSPAAPAPQPVVTPPPAATASAEEPAPTPLEAVLSAVREVLGPHSARVEPALQAAGPDVRRLRSAAESLRERRVRLLSRATMARAADRALAALAALETDPHTG